MSKKEEGEESQKGGGTCNDAGMLIYPFSDTPKKEKSLEKDITSEGGRTSARDEKPRHQNESKSKKIRKDSSKRPRSGG